MKGRNLDGLKKLSIGMAAFVYVGVIIFFDVMFLTVVERMFPGDPFLRALSYVGAVAVGVSAVTIPLAFHFWVHPGLQFWVCVVFWVSDAALLALNTMLAFQIATHGIDHLTDFWSMYIQFVPAAPVVALLGWGALFLLDPSMQERHSATEMRADLIDAVTEHRRQAVKSNEVYQIVLAGAMQDAQDVARSLFGNRSEVRPGIPPKTSEPEPEPSFTPPASNPSSPGNLIDRIKERISSNGHDPAPASTPPGDPKA